MEIKIDTKKDSPDDIRKTIDFLKTLIDSSGGSSNFNTTSEAANGMVGLFGDTPVLGNSTDETAKAASDDEEEEEKGKIELIPY